MDSGYFGERGENQVIYSLNLLKSSFVGDFYIYDDVFVQKGNSIMQIDALVVCKYGVFVLEVKNWRGQVFGDFYLKNWKHYSYGRKTWHLNPIIQNSMHVNKLRLFLEGCSINLDEGCFKNYVLFPKYTNVEATHNSVVRFDELPLTFTGKQTLNSNQIRKLAYAMETLKVLEEQNGLKEKHELKSKFMHKRVR